MTRLIAAIAGVAIAMSACSYIRATVVRPEDTSCASSLPLIDGGVALASAVAVIWAASPSCDQYDYECAAAKEDRVYRIALPAVAIGTGSVTSMLYGFSANGACRDRRDYSAQRAAQAQRRAQGEELIARARTAASTDDCRQVLVLDAQVQTLNPKAYQSRFATDPGIQACLTGEARKRVEDARIGCEDSVESMLVESKSIVDRQLRSAHVDKIPACPEPLANAAPSELARSRACALATSLVRAAVREQCSQTETLIAQVAQADDAFYRSVVADHVDVVGCLAATAQDAKRTHEQCRAARARQMRDANLVDDIQLRTKLLTNLPRCD